MSPTDCLMVAAFGLLCVGGLLLLKVWLEAASAAWEQPWDDAAGLDEAAFVAGGSEEFPA